MPPILPYSRPCIVRLPRAHEIGTLSACIQRKPSRRCICSASRIASSAFPAIACGRPRRRRDKPRASAFTSADIPKILALRPDLVLSFSDLQADIVASLIRQGAAVHAFNQRRVADIFDMICMVGAIVGAANKADRLASELEAGIADARRRGQQLRHRPLVYFEEWDEPMISGIGWVSELTGIAGGTDIFASGDREVGK
jgi:ABC-type Fe3+-hydroxamate transport system substrate-binding protein